MFFVTFQPNEVLHRVIENESGDPENFPAPSITDGEQQKPPFVKKRTVLVSPILVILAKAGSLVNINSYQFWRPLARNDNGRGFGDRRVFPLCQGEVFPLGFWYELEFQSGGQLLHRLPEVAIDGYPVPAVLVPESVHTIKIAEHFDG